MSDAPDAVVHTLTQRVRRLRTAAAAFAVLVLVLGAAYLTLALRDIEAAALERVSLYSRVIESQTAAMIDGVSTLLDSVGDVLESRLADIDPVHSGHILADSITGQTALRSLSLLDSNGRVLASTNADNVDRRIDLALLGGIPADRRERIGPMVAGRDLHDAGHAAADPVGPGTLSMLRRIERAGQSPLLLAALLNPDRFANQYTVLVGDAADRSALFTFDGQLLLAGRDVPLRPGTRPASLVPFTRYLPEREHGAYIDAGLDRERSVSAFRTLRQWPLVAMVEQPYNVVRAELFIVFWWVAGGACLAWAAIGIVTRLLHRDLRRQEQAHAEVAEAHAELARVEERWKLALDGADHGVWDADLRTGKGTVSARLMTMLGYAENEFEWTRERWAALVHPDDIQGALASFGEHLSGRAPAYEVELRMRTKEGHWKWIQARARTTPERDAAGRSVRMIGTNTDISRRKEAEAALRASEARQQAILRSSLDAIVTVGADGNVLDFNPAAESMFGYPLAEVVGQPLHELIVPPRHRQAHTEGMARYLATGKGPLLNRRIEIEALRSDGREFPVELTIVPVQTGDGEIFTATLRDITSRLRAERELATARARELEIGNRIQQSLLLTPPLENVAGLGMAAFSQASTGIDGDFFDVIRVTGDIVDVIAGDVMGKGIPAALLGAATKLQFSRSLAVLLAGRVENASLPTPAEIVTSVNRMMTPHLQVLESFVTLVYLRVDLRADRVTWVGCGHEETLLLDAGGGHRLLTNQHPPMGLFVDERFTQETCELRAGDALFLCSDGATDALMANGERIGRERIHASVARRAHLHGAPALTLHGVRHDLLLHDVSLTDDLTMVMLARHALTHQLERIEIPVSLDALQDVRRFVGAQATAAQLPEDRAAGLAVAAVEVVTNVIRHAQGLVPGAPIALQAERLADRLELAFSYFGDAYAPPAEPPSADLTAFPEGGFGLYIIHQACDEVAYSHEEGVNTVRLAVRRPA